MIEWSDPPTPPRPRRGIWRERLAPVMSERGRWALVHVTWSMDSAYSARRALRDGRYKAPPGRWEYSAGQRDGDSYGVWARYLGPEEET